MNDQKNTASASGNTFEQFCERLLTERRNAKADILQFLESASEVEADKFYGQLLDMCIHMNVSSIAKQAWEGFNPEQREQAQRRIREVLKPGHIPDIELMYQGSDMKKFDLPDTEVTIAFIGPRSKSPELLAAVDKACPSFRMHSVSGRDSSGGWSQVSESGMVFPRRNSYAEGQPVPEHTFMKQYRESLSDDAPDILGDIPKLQLSPEVIEHMQAQFTSGGVNKQVVSRLTDPNKDNQQQKE